MELADHIFLKRDVTAQPEWIADILTRLVWLTEDDGDEILRSLRRWLDGDDLAKIEIALAFDEVWLWQTRDEMDATLAAVEVRFPAMLKQCARLRKAWQMQFSDH